MKIILSLVAFLFTIQVNAQDNIATLHKAIDQKQNKLIDSLVKAGTDLNAVHNNFTALALAMTKVWGDRDTVLIKYLLENKANPNVGNEVYGTPLAMIAATQMVDYRLPFMKLLHRYGAKINMEQENLPAPLYKAIQYNCIDAALWLIRQGATIQPYYLAEALETNNLTRLEKDKKSDGYILIDTLIRLTQLPGSRNSYLLSALGMAVQNGDLSLVKKLIEKDSTLLTKKLPEGRAAFPLFIHAAYKQVSYPYTIEHLEILKLLAKKGADIHVVTIRDYQQSITHHNNPKIVKGMNALDIAIQSKASKEAIDYLRSIGLKETKMAGQ